MIWKLQHWLNVFMLLKSEVSAQECTEDELHDPVCVCVCVCECVSVWVWVCVCVCVSVRVYVVYEDTNLYNDMGMTEVLQYEGGLWGHCLCPRNSKGLKNILNGVFLKI